MLEDALGSRSKIRILRELLRKGSEEVTTDDLVRATGQSTGTLVPALQQLVAIRVVATRLVGKTRVFRADHGHPLLPSLRRMFEEETRAIHALADAIVRKVPKDGLRYAAWVHDNAEEERGQKVWLFVIADDPKAVEAVLVAPLEAGLPVQLKVMSPDEAKSSLSTGDPRYRRMIEQGRIVHADERWLKSA